MSLLIIQRMNHLKDKNTDIEDVIQHTPYNYLKLQLFYYLEHRKFKSQNLWG